MWMVRAFIMAIWLPVACAAVEPGIPDTSPARLAVSVEKMPFGQRPLSMVKMPGGRIRMPTTRPGMKTEIVGIRPIWVAMTELTWDQYDPWRLCADLKNEEEKSHVIGVSRPSLPYDNPDRGYGVEGYPAIGVTSHSAQQYCRWLSAVTGKKYRLPTEAEWEYACRCGGEALRPGEAELKPIAWFDGNSHGEDQEPATAAVARKQPNAWGLYDMLGNAGEWAVGYDGRMVLKGGSFLDPAEKVNSDAREPYHPDWQMNDPASPKSRWWLRSGPFAGFRVVRATD